jgi:hypothetical protein
MGKNKLNSIKLSLRKKTAIYLISLLLIAGTMYFDVYPGKTLLLLFILYIILLGRNLIIAIVPAMSIVFLLLTVLLHIFFKDTWAARFAEISVGLFALSFIVILIGKRRINIIDHY